VAEWTSSKYLIYENPPSKRQDAYGPDYNVFRGGSYMAGNERGVAIPALRCAARRSCRPEAPPEDVGFRCVKPAE